MIDLVIHLQISAPQRARGVLDLADQAPPCLVLMSCGFFFLLATETSAHEAAPVPRKAYRDGATRACVAFRVRVANSQVMVAYSDPSNPGPLHSVPSSGIRRPKTFEQLQPTGRNGKYFRPFEPEAFALSRCEQSSPPLLANRSKDALAVCFSFNVIGRSSHAFGFSVPVPKAFEFPTKTTVQLGTTA
jgi:hypothetical protein